MTDTEDIKADIERIRGQLSDTVDALSARLDVKARAWRRAREVVDRAVAAYDHAKAGLPPPAQQALGRTQDAARPLIVKAQADPQRAARLALAVMAVLLLVRRVRAHRRH